MTQPELAPPPSVARRRERSCVGCRRVDTPERLVRLVLGPGGQVVPDLASKAFGRGAWVHPATTCLAQAPRALKRSFRAEVTTSVAELWQSLRSAADRRIEALLGAAERAGLVAVGSTAAEQAFAQHRASLILVATDARATADSAWVYEAVRTGIGLGWGSKIALGRATRRDEVGVVAVMDDRVAKALAFAVGVAEVPAPAPDSRNVLAGVPTEDG